MFGSTWRRAIRDGIADRPRGEHVVLGFHRERCPTREPDEDRRRRYADRDHCVGEARSEECGERDREDQERAGEERVGHARDQHVDLAAGIAGQQSHRHADRKRDKHRQHACLERRAGAEDDAGQHVAADLVGAEPVRRTRCLAHRREIGRDRIVRRDERCKCGNRHEGGDDRERDGGRRTAQQPSQRMRAARGCRAGGDDDGRIDDGCHFSCAGPSQGSDPPHGGARAERAWRHSSQASRRRGFATAYRMSATRFSRMYAVAVNSTTPWTTA